MSVRPHDEAHYWAKQINSRDPGYIESLTGEWEVVQTYDNGGSTFDLRVFVPGRDLSEDLSCFVWGPRVVRPAGCDT